MDTKEQLKKDLQKWAYKEPNLTEGLGTYEVCRFCNESRSRLYMKEWDHDIPHKEDCLYARILKQLESKQIKCECAESQSYYGVCVKCHRDVI